MCEDIGAYRGEYKMMKKVRKKINTVLSFNKPNFSLVLCNVLDAMRKQFVFYYYYVK